MDALCSQCARLSILRRNATAWRGYQKFRSFSTVQSHASDDKKVTTKSSQGGQSIADGLADGLAGGKQASTPRRPIVRKFSSPLADRAVDENSQEAGRFPASTPITNTARIPAQILRRTPSQDGGLVIRRSPSADQPVLRRTGESQTGKLAIRTRRPGGNDSRSALGGRGQQSQNARFRGKGPGAKGPDRRRRLAPRQEEDDTEMEEVEQTIAEQIEKNIDPSPNPTTFIPYNPSKIDMDSLRADWPNTPLSNTGMTESVIQKIEWLARRLPHGYQSPEQIAEHYLKGNLTRFESDAEREMVLKLASELSAKTKSDADAGVLHKHESPRFQNVNDPTFTSLVTKSTEKTFLVEMGVKGDYENIKQQEYPFLQNAARTLNNNETYGPNQAQKVLSRIEALMPQARGTEVKNKTRTKM